MSGAQFAAPIALWYGMHKMAGGALEKAGAWMGGGLLGGAGNLLGRGIAKVPGMGGIGGAISSAAISPKGLTGLGRILGTVGAGFATGGLALAASDIVDRGVFDPYVATRKATKALQANYGNQFMLGGGDTAGGKGMSSTRAQEIAEAMTQMGQNSINFETKDIGEIADLSQRAGLFNNFATGDNKKMIDTTIAITKAVSTIGAIAGDKDFQTSIERMARLKNLGVTNIKDMATVVGTLSGAAAISGTNVDQIMNTVGNQGAMYAQQQGLRGITGMLAAADAYSSFTNARKMGLMSSGQAQSLGGMEGMTQHIMSALFKTTQNPLVQMGNHE